MTETLDLYPPARPPAALLKPKGIGVADRPPQIFEYGLADHDRLVRTFEPAIAAHLPDEIAWASLFDDEFRLSVFRSTYGNRPRSRRRGS